MACGGTSLGGAAGGGGRRLAQRGEWALVRVSPLGRETHPLSVAVASCGGSMVLSALVTASGGNWSRQLAALAATAGQWATRRHSSAAPRFLLFVTVRFPPAASPLGGDVAGAALRTPPRTPQSCEGCGGYRVLTVCSRVLTLRQPCPGGSDCQVEVTGPFPTGGGNWSLADEPALLLIAGGTGVYGWLPALAGVDGAAGRQVHLAWCVKTDADYLALAGSLPPRKAGVKITIFVTGGCKQTRSTEY